MPGNNFVPLVSNLHFFNISEFGHGGVHAPTCGAAYLTKFARACKSCNQSNCYNTQWGPRRRMECPGNGPPPSPPLPPQTFVCKRTAKTLFGEITLPWGVCIPTNAPVNINPRYPNFGPTTGDFASLAACKSSCV